MIAVPGSMREKTSLEVRSKAVSMAGRQIRGGRD